MKRKISILMMVGIILICGFVRGLNDKEVIINIPMLEEATVYENSPDTNFNNSNRLRVGIEWDGNNYSLRRVFLKWNISSLPDQAEINSAIVNPSPMGGINDPVIYVYESLSNNWSEYTITWNNMPGYNNSIISTGNVSQNYKFDITDFIKNKDDVFSIVLKTNESIFINDSFKIFQDEVTYIELNVSTNAPVIENLNIPNSINEGEWLNVTFDATDLDGNIDTILIYKDGIEVSNTNSYEWHIDYMSSGIYNFTIYVNDSTGLEDWEYKTLTVNETPSLVINEFVSNPDYGPEWIELYNPTDSDFNIAGCVINDGIGTPINLVTGIIPSGLADYLNITFSFLDNGGDKIRLKCDNITLDVVSYGDWDDGNISDNAPVPQNGYSSGRWDDGYDTDVDMNDFMMFTNPTKGYINNDHDVPSISNISNESIDDDSATILWSTDENASSRVYYGKTTSLGEKAASGGYTIDHSVNLGGLDQNTTYYYKVEGCDETDNCENSSIYDFMTLGISCHSSDTDCDGCVDSGNLIAYIVEWRGGSVSSGELIVSIDLWRNGVGC